ncbi:3-oxoacyl-[acyl-carrier-protein] reductase [Membranicola marinus]|uniref:3-oxoacyl-[acyl-carrier-protein] reductase n=1 Tax=Membranihabitans marinus TaxID=1227546 RepID=A0A953HS79_9BACT|nr:3-oxoacyl-[acyl-carrier-protein] reductase [Membranihabitans marinus]MBY5957306.1 3-oxoacyl-[acyl-carrier-protein] reductase [Membranihabitans marinus]
MNILKDRVVLVTGGSRGIGAGIVKTMADQGAKVAFTYRSSSVKADELIASLDVEEGRVKSYQSDASDAEQSEALVKQVLSDFGTIHVLVNNAGITRDTLMLRMNESQWDDVIRNNLTSVFHMTKQVLRPMMKNRQGSIINLSSVVGMMGNAGQANYAASKAGILGFTKSIAKELGSRNVRCNAIAPGFIETEMTDDLKNKEDYLQNIPMKRFGSVEEIAAVVLFLASDLSSYVNGQVISVCGGMNT